jgi:putative membrane protein insertion efficiency factor
MRQFAKLITLRVLRAYQWAISPLFPPACRYVPTCSEYAMEAVERYGPLRGGWITLGRILRCHPLGGSGYDPVVKIHPAQKNSESSCASCHGVVRGNL